MRRHSDTLRGAQRRRKRGLRGENNRTSFLRSEGVVFPPYSKKSVFSRTCAGKRHLKSRERGDRKGINGGKREGERSEQESVVPRQKGGGHAPPQRHLERSEATMKERFTGRKQNKRSEFCCLPVKITLCPLYAPAPLLPPLQRPREQLQTPAFSPNRSVGLQILRIPDRQAHKAPTMRV